MQSTGFSLILSHIHPSYEGEIPTTIDGLEEIVPSEGQKKLLKMVEQYPLAFRVSEEVPTDFEEAIEGFQAITSAVSGPKILSTGKSFQFTLEKIHCKVARSSYKLLDALFNEEQLVRDLDSQLDGKSFPKGLSILQDTLASDEKFPTMVYVAKTKLTNSILRGKGYFSAPAGLERVSPGLRQLDFTQLWIKNVLPSIGQFQHLVVLNLSENPIRNLPDTIGQLTALRELNINSCSKISQLPESISQCVALNTLRAKKTKIESLPDGMTSLLNLKKVDLRSTPFDPRFSDLFCALVDNGVTVKVKVKRPSTSESQGSISLDDLMKIKKEVGDLMSKDSDSVDVPDCAQQ